MNKRSLWRTWPRFSVAAVSFCLTVTIQAEAAPAVEPAGGGVETAPAESASVSEAVSSSSATANVDPRFIRMALPVISAESGAEAADTNASTLVLADAFAKSKLNVLVFAGPACFVCAGVAEWVSELNPLAEVLTWMLIAEKKPESSFFGAAQKKGTQIMLDPNMIAMKRLGVGQLPAVWVVSDKGVVHHQLSGLEVTEDAVVTLLKQQGVTLSDEVRSGLATAYAGAGPVSTPVEVTVVQDYQKMPQELAYKPAQPLPSKASTKTAKRARGKKRRRRRRR